MPDPEAASILEKTLGGSTHYYTTYTGTLLKGSEKVWCGKHGKKETDTHANKIIQGKFEG